RTRGRGRRPSNKRYCSEKCRRGSPIPTMAISKPAGVSAIDVQTIAAWVDGGAKEGDAADLPKVPQFAEGWQIGTPDLILTMKEPYTIPATGTIAWQTLPAQDYTFPEDTWIQAIEVRPGNRKVVHHGTVGV